VDVLIAMAMYDRALGTGLGQDLQIQNEMIFEHARLKDWVRICCIGQVSPSRVAVDSGRAVHRITCATSGANEFVPRKGNVGRAPNPEANHAGENPNAD
jgi:hypothetical protein